MTWLSYIAGFKTAFELDMDRNISSLYSSINLQIKILGLLSKNESKRSFNALESGIKSDISIMKEYDKIRNEMTYIDFLKSSFSDINLISNSPSKIDIDQLESKVVKIEKDRTKQ